MDKKYLSKMNKLSKKVALKTGLSNHDINGILKVVAFELVEVLKKEQRFYWDGLGIFRVDINDKGMRVVIRLSEDAYERLNKKEQGEMRNEIIFE